MPGRFHSQTTGERRRAPAPAFTLVEMLAVIAVIATLAGLLLPAVGAARVLALRTQTRLQFSRWSAALELYRQEYGCYPALGTEGKLATAADTLRFVRTLSGRNPDGSAVAAAADLNGNVKRLPFCAFAATDFLDPSGPAGGVDYSGDERLCDAFGNTEIGVLVDGSGDGLVKPADDGPVAAVRGAAGGRSLAPAADDLPDAGVHAGALFYSPGRGMGAADMVLSWK